MKSPSTTLGSRFALLIAVVALSLTVARSARAETPSTPASSFTEKLSSQNATLVLVDYLEGFFPAVQTIGERKLRGNAQALARLGKNFKLPTIVLGDEGGWLGKFFPEVIKEVPDAPRVPRTAVSAWDEPKFREQIKAAGRKRIIVAGISTDICITMLTLDLLREGYQVYVVVDASATDTTQNEQSALSRMVQAGATLTGVSQLGSELLRDWKNPEGPALGALYEKFTGWGDQKKNIP